MQAGMIKELILQKKICINYKLQGNPTHEGTGTRRPSWKNISLKLAEGCAKNNLVVGFLKSIRGPILVR